MNDKTPSNKQHIVVRATLSVSLVIILSKLLGFAREAVVAAYYGATEETDAFFFAQNMPSMLFPSVCMSISTAFVSLYVKRIGNDGERTADRYASRMLCMTSLLGVLLSLLGALCSPLLVPLLAPGFAGEQLALAIRLSQLIMATFFLTMLQYMLTAILNSKQIFVRPQIAGLLYSSTIVALTLLLGPNQSVYTLTLITIVSMVVFVAALALCCVGHFPLTLRISPFHRESAQLLRLALPILLGNSVLQINTIVDKALGSTLPNGSLSALSYGSTLNLLVISVFVTSLSTVLYPTLTSDATTGNMEQYGNTLEQSLSGLSLILMPVTVISVLSAKDIVSFVYARGAFDAQAVSYTATVLACYAPMFVFSGIREVLTRGFFALQDTVTPMWNSAIGVGFNIAFSLIFVRYIGIAGIALGTTLSTVVTACLLLYNTRKKLPALHMRSFSRLFCKQCIAGAVACCALMVFSRCVTLPYALLRFLAASLVGFTVYGLVLLVLRYPTPNYFKKTGPLQ